MSGKLKMSCIQSRWEQDKSDENKPECPAIGSLFPHLCMYVFMESIYSSTELVIIRKWTVTLLEVHRETDTLFTTA